MVEENTAGGAEQPLEQSSPPPANQQQPQAGIQGAGSLVDLNGRIELVDDNIILNEEFKKNVAIPYFKDIYKDLAAQSDSKSKGINKVAILNVSHHFFKLGKYLKHYIYHFKDLLRSSTRKGIVIWLLL